MSTVQLALNDIACSGCIGKIKRGIKKQAGIEKVQILSGSGYLHIHFNEKMIKKEEIHHLVNQLALRMFD
ncbi:MAG: heavy-metal-associated domain-containing protein [Bacillota bacterium]|nr:heavy-metal-associated domain-containing protein [Bacillota bacterium]